MVTVLQQHYPSLRSLIALQCGIYNIKYIHIVTLSCQSYHISPATNLCWQLHQTFRTSNILWFIFDLPKQYYLNIYLRILVSSKQSTTIISLKGWQKSCFTFELLVLQGWLYLKFWRMGGSWAVLHSVLSSGYTDTAQFNPRLPGFHIQMPLCRGATVWLQLWPTSAAAHSFEVTRNLSSHYALLWTLHRVSSAQCFVRLIKFHIHTWCIKDLVAGEFARGQYCGWLVVGVG